MVILLNSPVLTDYGSYEYRRLTLEQAREMLAGGFRSAIGHAGTAQVMSEDFGVPIPVCALRDQQQPGERALVFRLRVSDRQALRERKELDAAAIREIEYEYGQLERLA